MRVSASSQVPFAVQEALVDAAGKVFWYRRPFAQLLKRSGVPDPLVDRLVASGESKFTVVREVLAELDQRGKSGVVVQRQLIAELVFVEPGDGADHKPAQAAQRTLRKVAEQHGLLTPPRRASEPADASAARRKAAEQQSQEAAKRRSELLQLHNEFSRLSMGTDDAQERGYRLEGIIGELAALEALRYVPPFRKGTVTQTDGMLTVDGFQYLIEARWRAKQPDAQALGSFSAKVSRNMQSTRGFFLSMVGFREEVVAEIATGAKNLVLMSGQELALILEERWTLRDALRRKVEEGAKKGTLFFDLAGA